MYDVRPGDIWQPDDMHCLEQAAAFVGSKEVIVEDYRRERHNIKFARAEAEEYMKSLAPPSIHLHPHTQKSKKENAWNGSEESDDEDEDQDEEVREVREVRGTRAYRRAKANFEKLDAMYADKLANPPSRTHRALIKLSVWPVIRRYTPGSAAEDSEPNKPLHEKDGFRIFLIAKAGVVAYYGREEGGGSGYRRGDEDGYVRLEEWIAINERQREEKDWKGLVGRGARNAVRASSVVAAIVATGLVGRVVDRAIGVGIADEFKGWLEGAFEGALRNVVNLVI